MLNSPKINENNQKKRFVFANQGIIICPSSFEAKVYKPMSHVLNYKATVENKLMCEETYHGLQG